jgi:hypothetical protein
MALGLLEPAVVFAGLVADAIFSVPLPHATMIARIHEWAAGRAIADFDIE